jgi:DHA2 family lincomycin resistance protein-like MFS transporter
VRSAAGKSQTEHPSSEADQRGSSAALPAGAGLVIAVLVLAAFVMLLNETVLSVALPTLSDPLRISTSTVQWVTSGFLLTTAVVIPTTGYLLERFTERQVFLAACLLFTAGTLICALAAGFGVLMVGRVLQACGTAMVMPLLMTTVMRMVPESRRGGVIGIITVVIAFAPALGPTVGGVILARLDWRWLFWSVLPLMVLTLAVGLVKLSAGASARAVPLDVLSIPLAAIGFGGLLYGLSAVGAGGTAPAVTGVTLGVGALGLTAFILRQLRMQKRDRAMLDLRPMANRTFAVALSMVAMLFMCMIAVVAVLLPLYLQTVHGEGTLVSGLVMLPGGLVLGVLGPIVGRVYDRLGARILVLPGAVISFVGLCLLAVLGAHTPLWLVVVAHVLLMSGVGMMMTPLMTDALSALPEQLYSHGSAIMATVQQVVGALGIALFVTVAAMATRSEFPVPDAAGLHTAFLLGAVIGGVVVAMALLVKSPARAGR